MTMTLLSPAQARAAIEAGALLVDIRDGDEYAREHIPGATNVPLARLDTLPDGDRPVIFHCRSGMRTATHAARIETAAKHAPAHILDGGIDAWRRAGLPTVADRSQPIEVMRQVQITAGALVLLGVLLGISVAPGFLFLAGFVGAGLLFAGASGWCGMATLLRKMPWNRRAVA
jgi:rhodanese-related sulfurtransferase